jgi:hypothetical protein
MVAGGSNEFFLLGFAWQILQDEFGSVPGA